MGSLELPSNIFYAPLAGWTDFPYRAMCSQYHPGLQYCEMVKMDALVRYDPNTFHLLDYSPEMHPIGAQLCGSKPEIAGQAAKIIEDLGFDIIDLNCGCPVDKVTKDGSGSGLLKNPELIGEILSEMVAAVSIPVSVKIRAGWDSQHVNAVTITRIAEQAGAVAIAIHGRTRAQGYQGHADWSHIAACKEAAQSILVIGNGDVFDPYAAQRMFEETNCDAVLVSRGTMGKPWIADNIYRLMEGRPLVHYGIDECRKALLEHFTLTTQYHNDRRVLIDMRRVGCSYFKELGHVKGARKFRGAISKAQSLEEMKELILTFPFDLVDEEE